MLQQRCVKIVVIVVVNFEVNGRTSVPGHFRIEEKKTKWSTAKLIRDQKHIGSNGESSCPLTRKSVAEGVHVVMARPVHDAKTCAANSAAVHICDLPCSWCKFCICTCSMHGRTGGSSGVPSLAAQHGPRMVEAATSRSGHVQHPSAVIRLQLVIYTASQKDSLNFVKS